MNRREFFYGSMGGAVAQVSSRRSAVTLMKRGAKPHDDGKLAGMTLAQLRDQFHYDLFDDFLPFMDKYVIDHRYGGFMCNTDRDGTHLSEKKEAWLMGRGVWVYSFLYNNFGHNKEHLKVARNAAHFLMKANPSVEKNFWPSLFSRQGKPLDAPAKTIFGDLFIAEGFAEYSKASDDQTYWNLAKTIILRCLRLYNRPDYDPDVVAGYNDLIARYGSPLPPHLDPKIVAMYKGPKAIPFPGARAQAVAMVLIRNISQMLEMRPDKQLEGIIANCVQVVLEKHFNPEFRLNNELLNHDYSRPNNVLDQFVYTGHSIETLEGLLFEAQRTTNDQLFNVAAQRFQRHSEVAWDDVYGGVLRSLNNVDANEWSLDKVLWAQEELLNGLLFVVEHRNAPWARAMFSKAYRYVRAKYPLRKHGFHLWITAADRKVTFERHAARVENYHHPRFLMLSLLALNRMIRNRSHAWVIHSG